MGFGDAVTNAIKNALGVDELGAEIPGWQKRLKTAAYTGPSGNRIEFQFVDLKRTIGLRRAVFRFNGINGRYIQSNGHDEGDYPMVCFFTGDDQDRIGTAFEGLLTEDGPGRLEHPMYGTFDVVPMGTIERENLMVSAANQTVINVTLSSTLANVYPEFGAVPKNTITQTIAGWEVAAAEQFASDVNLEDPLAQTLMANSVSDVLISSAATIRKASEGLAAAQRAYDNQARKITQSINTLVTAPANLGGQLIELLKSTVTPLIDLHTLLSGYAFFSSSRINNLDDVKSNNEIALTNLILSCATNAAVQAANTQEFKNRPDALDAANNISELNDVNSAALDTLFSETGFTDTGDGYHANQKAVSELLGKLVSDSFDLLRERVIYLETDKATVDLCGSLYGDVSDSVLQAFMDNNRIGGDEIYLLERGRRISYYAE